MQNIAIDSWLVIMGMSGLALVAVIGVSRLLHRLFTAKRKPAPVEPAADKRRLQFEDEMRVQVFRQQADKAFQSISAVIDAEYQRLLKLVETDRQPVRAHRQPSAHTHWEPAAESAPRAPVARRYSDCAPTSPYAQIESYIGQGLNPGDISDLLQIPQHEVELAVKLKSAKHAAGARQ